MESSTLQREVKKVRKARNRRQEWNMMAIDKELRPDHRHPQTLRRGTSSEGSLSPDGRLDLVLQLRMCFQIIQLYWLSLCMKSINILCCVKFQFWFCCNKSAIWMRRSLSVIVYSGLTSLTTPSLHRLPTQLVTLPSLMIMSQGTHSPPHLWSMNTTALMSTTRGQPTPQQRLTLQSKWTVQYVHLQSMFVWHLHNQRKN